MGLGASVLANACLLYLVVARRRSEMPPFPSEALIPDNAEPDLSDQPFADSPWLGIFLARLDGSWSGLANRAFLEMMGMAVPAPAPSGGIPCRLSQPLVPGMDPMRLLATGSFGPAEIELRQGDGTTAYLLVIAESRRDYPGWAVFLAVDVGRYQSSRQELRRSDERYRVLAESSPICIWQIDPEGRTLYLNPVMAGVLELEHIDDLVGTQTHYGDFFSPESQEAIKAEFARRQRGITSAYEAELIGRWGKRTRMMVYGSPIMGTDGRMESSMGIFVDITARKREEEALRESEERLRVAAECGRELIYEWEIATSRRDWFGPFDQRLGYALGETPRTQAGWESLLHPEDRPRIEKAIDQHLRSRQPFLEEYRIRCSDGSYLIWSDRGTAIWDAAGAPRKWIGTTSDVTQSRRAEDDLRGREEQLRQAQKLEAVGRLAGGIAHDFNNLLAAIMGYCELMLIRLEPEHPCRREVGEILNGSDRAAGLIRQLLAFSRQEIPQPKVISPIFIVRSMERMLRHVVEESVELRIQMDDDTGSVRMDPVQMEQVILNLVLNSRDAMPNGGSVIVSSGNVDLHGEVPGAYGRVHAGPHVRISVADTGLGIGREHLPHIFDPFYTTKDKGKGSGLGLSTVYGIVTQNHGCVLVETEVHKGSVFSFFLPLCETPAPEESEVRRAIRSSSVIPKTVLLVEDDDEVRAIVRELLNQQGFHCLEAKQGVEALALAEKCEQPIHLLLTDVVMPEMGGKELADALKLHLPHLRVLYMSGYTQDAVFRDEVARGGRNFIQKPFALGTLLTKIREVLSSDPEMESVGV